MTKEDKDYPFEHHDRSEFKSGWNGWINRPYWKRKRTYEPFYDENKDYNTNAKSYYDYLARFNHYIKVMTHFINRLMNRNIEVKNTPSINFHKKGDWIDNGTCEPDNFDDITELSADVIISKMTELRNLVHLKKKEFIIENGSEIKSDGMWSPDYMEILNEIDDEIGRLQVRVSKNEQDIIDIYNKLIDINKRIDGILGMNTEPLIKGQDYEIEWFNGFYNPPDDLAVSVIETDSTVKFFVRTTSAGDYKLYNDRIVDVEMAHATHVINSPDSWIFKIKLIGDYAQYSNKPIIDSSLNNNLLNIRPASLRASWNASLGVWSRDIGFIFNLVGYADGYNTSFNVYNNSDMYLEGGNMNTNFTIIKD